MMVETSPDMAAALGIDPKSYPIATFLGGLGLWATNLWLCLEELRAMRPPAPKPGPAAAKPPGHSQPGPASPAPALLEAK